MLATDEIESRSALPRIPELTPLALTHRIVCQYDVSALHQIDMQNLIDRGSFAYFGMATRAEDARQLAVHALGPIEQCRHEISRQAFEHQLVNDIVVRLKVTGIRNCRRSSV